MKPPPKPRTPQRQDAQEQQERQEQRASANHSAQSEARAASVRRRQETSEVRTNNGAARVQRNALNSSVAPKPESSQSGAISARKRVSSSGEIRANSERKFDLEPTKSKKQSELADFKPQSKIPVLTTGLTDRLAERKAIARHDLKKKRITWALIGVLFTATIWIFGYSKLFSLDLNQVQITGANTYVAPEQITKALADQADVPLFRLNLNKVNEQILSVKNVKSATQTRKWPKGITITISERVPVAAVPHGKKYTLLDIDAFEVADVEKAPEELPRIDIPTTGENRRTLTTALTILDSIPAELLAEIASISAKTQDDISFVLRDGLLVRWGNSQDTELKTEVLARLRPIAHKEEKRTIDLSAPTFPIIKK